MSENITAVVGLDVHKDSIAIAVAEPGRAAPRFLGTTGPALTEVQKALSHVGPPAQLLILYEAGPCGYGLARQLCARGYRCEVIAPTKIPRKAGDRVKTDRRDALANSLQFRSAASREDPSCHLTRGGHIRIYS